MPTDEQQVTTGLDAFRERVANYLVQVLRNPSDGVLIADLISGEAGILMEQGDDGYRRYLHSVRLVEAAAQGIDLDVDHPPATPSPLRLITSEEVH